MNNIIESTLWGQDEAETKKFEFKIITEHVYFDTETQKISGIGYLRQWQINMIKTMKKKLPDFSFSCTTYEKPESLEENGEKYLVQTLIFKKDLPLDTDLSILGNKQKLA